MTISEPSSGWTQPGTAEYRRMNLGLFLAGFASFSLMYCVQPLLVQFTQEFGIDAATSSLALSSTTAAVAITIVCVGIVSERFGRRGLMAGSMCLAAVLNLLAGLAPGWHTLVVLRALEGVALGGVPALAMTYLAEETDPKGLGFSMGLYVAGTAFGGMIGRVGMGLLTDFGSWRTAMVTIAIIDLVAALGFAALLPRSRRFVARRGWDMQFHAKSWKAHLGNASLRRLFMLAFLFMGVFVAVYNYTGFRLSGPEFGLDQTRIGMIFLSYILGMIASPVAGMASTRFGRARVLKTGLTIMILGLLLTLLHSLVAVILGIAMITVGFFTSHSLASAWVGSLGANRKGHAAALYLLSYYLGSSILGSVAGHFWQSGGWSGIAAFGGAAILIALWIAASLPKTKSLTVTELQGAA